MVVDDGEPPVEVADDGSFDDLVKAIELLTADEEQRKSLLTQMVMNSFLLRQQKDPIPAVQEPVMGFFDHAPKKKRSEKKRSERTMKTDAVLDSDSKFSVLDLETGEEKRNMNGFKVLPPVQVTRKCFGRENSPEKGLGKIEINFKSLTKTTGKRVCEDRDGQEELVENSKKKHKDS